MLKYTVKCLFLVFDRKFISFTSQSTLPFRKLSDFEKPVAKWEWVCEMGVDPQESLLNVRLRESTGCADNFGGTN